MMLTSDLPQIIKSTPISMPDRFVSSDIALLDLLRKGEALSISQLAASMEVTATAVRQRLNRLMDQGYVRRTEARAGRGRPSHRYALTQQGRRKTGSNFADLAIALWQEIREIKDAEVRRGLLQRLSRRLAEQYAPEINGGSLEERMNAVSSLFGGREVPFSVDESGDNPVLTALACPYPELAEQDRTICAMERMLFSEILGESVRLDKCRLDGEACCTFSASDQEMQEVGFVAVEQLTQADSTLTDSVQAD